MIAKRFFSLFILFALLMMSANLRAQTQTPEAYLQEGRSKMKRKEYKRAIIDFTIALEMRESVEAYLERAEAKRNIEDLEGAVEDYDGAISLSPQNPVLLNNRGNLREQLRLTLAALEDYNKAIALDSAYTNAYYNRAIAHYNLRHYEEAKRDFQQVLQLDDRDAAAYVGLALCEQKLGNTDQACANLLKAQKLKFEGIETYLEKYCP